LFVIIVIYLYFIRISQGSVHICTVVGYVMITVLQIVCRMWQWKIFFKIGQ